MFHIAMTIRNNIGTYSDYVYQDGCFRDIDAVKPQQFSKLEDVMELYNNFKAEDIGEQFFKNSDYVNVGIVMELEDGCEAEIARKIIRAYDVSLVNVNDLDDDNHSKNMDSPSLYISFDGHNMTLLEGDLLGYTGLMDAVGAVRNAITEYKKQTYNNVGYELFVKF